MSKVYSSLIAILMDYSAGRPSRSVSCAELSQPSRPTTWSLSWSKACSGWSTVGMTRVGSPCTATPSSWGRWRVCSAPAAPSGSPSWPRKWLTLAGVCRGSRALPTRAGLPTGHRRSTTRIRTSALARAHLLSHAPGALRWFTTASSKISRSCVNPCAPKAMCLPARPIPRSLPI